MRIGERIKQRRLELGYTADRLAKMLNKNRATIYRYENGDIENMPIDVLEPLAKALNTTPAYLMGWKDSEQSVEQKPTDGYYTDREAAEFAEYLRTRPGARMLFSAAKDIRKEDLEKAVEYIELLKLKKQISSFFYNLIFALPPHFMVLYRKGVIDNENYNIARSSKRT